MYDYIHIKYMRNNNCENSCYLHSVIIMRAKTLLYYLHDVTRLLLRKRWHYAITRDGGICASDLILNN